MGIITTLIATAAAKGVIKTVGKTAVYTAAGVADAVKEVNKAKQDAETVVYVTSPKPGKSKTYETIVKLKLPNVSNYIGDHYLKARAAFIAAGFRDISFIVKKDLTKGWLKKDGDVSEILIGGKTDIGSRKNFPPETPIVIVYHTFKDTLRDTPVITNVSATLESTNDSPNINDYTYTNAVAAQKSDEVVFCTECGAPQKESSRFCSKCGHKMI